jgi:hypothetical protein
MPLSIGSARVSIEGQDRALQRDALCWKGGCDDARTLPTLCGTDAIHSPIG